MIISTGKLGGLALITDRSLPQAGDSDIVTPPLFIDAFPIPMITQQRDQPAAGTLTVASGTTSYQSGFQVRRAAAAGSQITRLWTLGQGLWVMKLDYWVLIPSGTAWDCNLNGSFNGSNVNIFSFDDWDANIWPLYGHWEQTIMIAKDGFFRADLSLDNTNGTAPMAFTGSWNMLRYA